MRNKKRGKSPPPLGGGGDCDILSPMAKKKRSVEEMINELAGITAKGFAQTVTKDELERVIERLDKIDNRFDRVEFHMNTHERRIEMLEDRMRIVSTKIGLRK